MIGYDSIHVADQLYVHVNMQILCVWCLVILELEVVYTITGGVGRGQ